MNYAIETGSTLIIGALRASCLEAGNSRSVCYDESVPSSAIVSKSVISPVVLCVLLAVMLFH